MPNSIESPAPSNSGHHGVPVLGGGHPTPATMEQHRRTTNGTAEVDKSDSTALVARAYQMEMYEASRKRNVIVTVRQRFLSKLCICACLLS